MAVPVWLLRTTRSRSSAAYSTRSTEAADPSAQASASPWPTDSSPGWAAPSPPRRHPKAEPPSPSGCRLLRDGDRLGVGVGDAAVGRRDQECLDLPLARSQVDLERERRELL